MRIKKAVEIRDAKIQYVSLVDRAANGRRFLVTKNEDGSAAFSGYGRIVKFDDEAHYLTGIVYEPFVEDAHGNFMTEEEIRKAAYWFSKNGDKIDIQHSFSPADRVYVVESYVAPCDMNIAGELIAKGTWLMSVEVCDDEIWREVQKGGITGFSMGGYGRYSEENVTAVDAHNRRGGSANGVLKKLSAWLGFDDGEKENAEAYKGGFDVTRQEVQEMIDESIERALEQLLKTRGVSKNLNDETDFEETRKNEGNSFWKGII